MEKITYRKTLDVHRGGTQFLLQGFQTADRLSRVIELSLMASGDTIDFPLERVEAMMYITSPGMEKPSINACIIKDNKVIYEVLPIVVEGITTMQLKLIETSPEGAKSVLASPSFAVEVSKSGTDDAITEENKATFTALETAAANAKIAYDERLIGVELTSDGIFKVTYADGSEYTSDAIKRLSHGDNSVLAESYAKGGTGVRTDEEQDNAKYYSNVAKSEAEKASSIMQNSNDILQEVKLHGQYTAFTTNFETGNLEYVSPKYTFEVNNETGQLEVNEQANSFNDEVGAMVQEWLDVRGIDIDAVQNLAQKHSEDITALRETDNAYGENLNSLNQEAKNARPIDKGGTGATTAKEALDNLGGCRIYADSYVGGGGHGEENQMYIDMPFDGKLLFFTHVKYDNGNFAVPRRNMINISMLTEKEQDISPGDGWGKFYIKRIGDSIKWWAGYSDEENFNTKGYTYYYIIIG